MLEELFNKYGCDKSSKHKYHLVYEPDFEKIKNDYINILELGIFEGKSLQAWLDYFPNAMIYGIDIFTRLKPKDVHILNHERVKWIKGDSLVSKIQDQIEKEWSDIKFDIIIDDGKHTPEANKLSFKYLNKFLNNDGKYYIEDVWPLDIMNSQELSHFWLTNRPGDYNIDKMQQFLNEISSWHFERFDLRKSGEPDSYIIRIERQFI